MAETAEPSLPPSKLAFRPILGRSLEFLRGSLPSCAAIAMVCAPPFALADRVAAHFRFGLFESLHGFELAQLLTGVVASVSMARLFVGAQRGLRLSASQAILWGIRRWPAAAAVAYVSGLAISAGTIALGIPGLLVALNFCLATPLLAATELDANQALRRSRSLAFGHRKQMFLPLGSALLGAALLSEGLARLAELALSRLPPLGLPAFLLAIFAQFSVLLLDGLLIACQVTVWAALEEAAASQPLSAGRGSLSAPLPPA